MGYRIDFKLIFVLCIALMLFDRIWALFENRPEAFVYGNIIYHAITIISFVLTNISIGISASIIFYFMAMFLEKNKNFDMYTDLRADTLKLLYSHMKILHEIQEFEELKSKGRSSNWFVATDVPILIESFYKIGSDEQKTILKNNLMNYFVTKLCNQNQRLDQIMSDFEKNVKSLEDKKNTNYFKGSKDLIEANISMFGDDGDFVFTFDLFKNAKTKDELSGFSEELVKDYLYVLESSIDLYEELNKFIDSLENKRILTFIRMVE